MRYSLYLFLGLILVFEGTESSLAAAPYNMEWVHQFGGTDSTPTTLSVDRLGNVFIAGRTYDNLYLSNNNDSWPDGFVMKYNSSGYCGWGYQFTNDMETYAFPDDQGNVYLTNFSGNLNGADRLVQKKFNSNGDLINTVDLGVPFSGNGGLSNCYHIDKQGNTYIGGPAYMSYGSGGYNGGGDAWIRKYDASGSIAWTREMGSSQMEMPQSQCTDLSGNVYVSGYTTGSFGGPFVGGYSDLFVAKLASDGTPLWTKQLGSTRDEDAWKIRTDANGNVYALGRTGGDLGGPQFDNYDSFVSKYDSAGNLKWVRHIGTTGVDYARDLAVDLNGNVLVAGGTTGNMAGNNAGNYDGFLQEYDSSGNVLGTRQFGGSGDEHPLSIALDEAGNAYILGTVNGNYGGLSTGTGSLFLAKFNVIPEPSTLALLLTAIIGGLLRWRRKR